ncbi:MAG: hypothetical protein JWN37_455 [Candidatus Nomurabacteria bacterium]|nr:hypothetical protein [Candidatus Nomurabacteria bacterium]
MSGPYDIAFAQKVTEFNHRAIRLWNAGDLEGFCNGYAPDAVYASRDGILYGRKQILEELKQVYPDQIAMGVLTLDIQSLRTPPLSQHPYMGVAILKWTVSKKNSHEEGYSMVAYELDPFELLVVQDMSIEC